jgi:hypothetical protein
MGITRLVITLALLFAAPRIFAQCPGSPPSGMDCVNTGANKDITFFSTCAKVTNGHASGKAIMVPGASSGEWSDFRTKAPSGVTIGSCSAATPLNLAGIQGFAGFETGNLIEVGQTSVAAATFARSGSYSFGAAQGTLTSPSEVSITVSNSGTPRYNRVYVYVGAPVDNTEKELLYHSDGSIRQGVVSILGSGGNNYLRLRNGSIASAQIGSDILLASNTWNLIEWKITTGSGTAESTLKLNSTTVASATNLTITSAGGAMNLFLAANNDARTVYFDDILVSKVEWPGPGRVIARQPVGGTPTYSDCGAIEGANLAQTPMDITNSWTTNCAVSPATSTVKIDPFSAAAASSYSLIHNTYSGGYSASGITGPGGSGEQKGQSFTTVTATSVSAIEIRADVMGTITDTYLAEMVSGSINGTVMATSNAGVALSDGWFRFSFASPVSLSASTMYWFRVKRTGARDNVNYLKTYESSSPGNDDYVNGQYFTKTSGVWGAGSTQADMWFRMQRPQSTEYITSSGAINACKWVTVAKRSGGAGRTFSIVKRVNSTNSLTAYGLGTTDTWIDESKSTWSQPTFVQIDNVELGLEKSGGTAGQDATIEDFWYICDYQP